MYLLVLLRYTRKLFLGFTCHNFNRAVLMTIGVHAGATPFLRVLLLDGASPNFVIILQFVAKMNRNSEAGCSISGF